MDKKIDYSKELEYHTLDMMGATDEQLEKIMTPEEIAEYKEFIAKADSSKAE